MKNKKAFKESVRHIEVEIFSFCNRRCWFCPNSVIDRQGNNQFLNVTSYENLINDLKTIQYDNTISFGRYNEPLANKIIYDRISYARKRLPNATLHFNTNGDYLNRKSLEKCRVAGLSSMNIQIYDEGAPIKMIEDQLEKLNLKGHLTILNEDIVEYDVQYKNIKIRIYKRNFLNTGVNRGGIISKIKSKKLRTAPCFIPSRAVYIDYDGSVMPCCNLRSDWSGHKIFILGNINKNSIFEIFSSDKASMIRKDLLEEGDKIFPCNICHFSEKE